MGRGREGNSGWPGAFVGADCVFLCLSRRFPRAWSRGSATDALSTGRAALCRGRERTRCCRHVHVHEAPCGDGPDEAGPSRDTGTLFLYAFPCTEARRVFGGSVCWRRLRTRKTPDKRLGGTFLEERSSSLQTLRVSFLRALRVLRRRHRRKESERACPMGGRSLSAQHSGMSPMRPAATARTKPGLPGYGCTFLYSLSSPRSALSPPAVARRGGNGTKPSSSWRRIARGMPKNTGKAEVFRKTVRAKYAASTSG